MQANKNREIEDLKNAVERSCHCKANYIDMTVIVEKFGDEAVWQGMVYTFKVAGRQDTDTCYAWSSPIEGSTKRRYYSVLKISPIDSPEKAVRASIVKDSHG